MALLTIGLLVFGVVMVNSAGLLVGQSAQRISLEGLLLGAPAIHAILAIGALALGACMPLRWISQLRGIMAPAPWLLLGAVLLLLLVWAPRTGITLNNASRWLVIGGVRFQASEFAKWMMPLFLAWFIARRPDAVARFWRGLLPALAIVGGVAVLIAIEDLGTAVLLVAVAGLMLLAGGARVWHLAMLVPIGVLGVVGGIMAEPYRLRRLTTFLDPFADPEGGGWHIIQSLRAIAGGGVAGRGLGAGEQKFDLTSDTTDFIFSIVCEELGVVGAGLLVCGFIALLALGGAIIARPSRVTQAASTESFLRLLGLGVLLTVGLQALFNIMVVTAMVPTKGIALPLVSRGGTGWILTAFMLGMLVAVERCLHGRDDDDRDERAPEQTNDEPPAPGVLTG